MGTQLSVWANQRQVVRAGSRELAAVQINREIAEERVASIGSVTNVAMMCTGGLSMTRKQLELLAPETAGRLEHLETIAVIAMGNEIRRLAGK